MAAANSRARGHATSGSAGMPSVKAVLGAALAAYVSSGLLPLEDGEAAASALHAEAEFRDLVAGDALRPDDITTAEWAELTAIERRAIFESDLADAHQREVVLATVYRRLANAAAKCAIEAGRAGDAEGFIRLTRREARLIKMMRASAR
jgi:hypothetical protein